MINAIRVRGKRIPLNTYARHNGNEMILIGVIFCI